MSSPQVSSSVSLPLPLFYHPVRQFSIIISTFLLLRAMLDKIRHTRIVPVCLPGQWWTLNNQLWRVWEGLHILSSQSPPSEGGGAWRWGNEREHVKQGMKQAGVIGLKSEGCRQQKRWEDYEIPPPALKTKQQQLPNQFWCSFNRIYILFIWCPANISDTDQPAAHPACGMFHLAVPVFCLMGGEGNIWKHVSPF